MITNKQAKNARLILGISQNKVAKETGLSRPYLSNFEAGKFNPSDDFLEDLQAFYQKEGITFDDDKNKKVAPKKTNIPLEVDNMPPTPPNSTLRMIDDTFIVDTDFMAYKEAENLVRDDINMVAMELLELQEQTLPIENGFFNDSINVEELNKLTQDTIKSMAIAYLNIMSLQCNNYVSFIPREVPESYDPSDDSNDKYTVNDYLSLELFGKDE